MEKTTLYSQHVVAGNRSFFFDIREAENGNNYLVLTESQKTEEDKYKRKSMVLFEEDLSKIGYALMNCMLQFRAKDREQMVMEARRKYPNAFAKWNEEEDAQLKRLFNSGDSVAEIAQSLGRNHAAIQARLEKHKLVGNARLVDAA